MCGLSMLHELICLHNCSIQTDVINSNGWSRMKVEMTHGEEYWRSQYGNGRIHLLPIEKHLQRWILDPTEVLVVEI